MRPAVGGLFSFPLKIHFKSRQLPAGRGFFKISFALVIRATGFWQPAGREFFLSLPTPPHFEICQTGQAAFFWLHLPTTGNFAILPNGQQKKQQIFFRLTAFTGRRYLVFNSFSVRQTGSCLRVLIRQLALLRPFLRSL